MTITDPVSDMLTRVRNAVKARHDAVALPASKPKIGIARILKEEGFIRDYQVVAGPTPQKILRMMLKYDDDQPAITGLRRVSRPGLRIYAQKHEVPSHFRGVGISIVSTSQGMVVGKEAWRRGIGGEVLCYIW